jgi:phosphatidylserine/phosphatidylglycerophosphate/cardiolipin synthase-like enzyme
VTVCFTPGDNCTSAITQEIEQAKTEILVQAYSLTSKPIADAIVRAKDSGVSIEVILDRSSKFARNSATFFSTLKGIPTYLDGRHSIADNNMIVIDKRTVITGSYNFTNESDEKNAENLLIIKSDQLAGAYIDNWYEHKGHAEEFKNLEPQPEQPPQQPKIEKKKAGKKKKKL